MTGKPITDTSRRMGRPPLSVKPTLVRFKPEVLERIDALLGPNKRAEFIREVVEKELARREAKAKRDKE